MRRSITVTDPFTEIEKVPLFTPSGKQSSRYAIVLDPHGAHQEAGIVSADYNLVENQRVVESAERVLEQAEYEAEPGQLLFDGRRFRQRWILQQATFDVQVGDTIALTLDAWNSYDGTAKFGLAFTLQRLICSNGMVADTLLGGFRFKHNHSHGEVFDEEIEQAVNRLIQMGQNIHLVAPKFQQMVDKKLSLQGIQQVFTDLKLKRSLTADVFLALEGDTQWQVYNAFTDVLTRMNSFPAENLNRKVTRYFLDHTVA